MAKEMTPIMQAVVKVLNRNPAADFQTVKAKVASTGELFPIVYGRAKALLGLVKSKPRAVTAKAPAVRKARPADALQAAQSRRDKAASNGREPEGVVGRLESLLEQRDALNAKITTIVDAINA